MGIPVQDEAAITPMRPQRNNGSGTDRRRGVADSAFSASSDAIQSAHRRL